LHKPENGLADPSILLQGRASQVCHLSDQLIIVWAMSRSLGLFANRLANSCCSAAHERISCLFGKTVTDFLIARRLMQSHYTLYLGQSRDRSGLPCRQMVTHLGERCVSFFDKKNVRILREPNAFQRSRP
jgi:hypothetical protein